MKRHLPPKSPLNDEHEGSAIGGQCPSSQSHSGSDQVDKGAPKRAKRSHWPEGLHRAFVSAVFEVGMKHSSPTALLDQMADNNELTVERVKSHLQKFRKNREKSHSEFIDSYDSALARFLSEEARGSPPSYTADGFRAGEAAAFLAHASMAEDTGKLVQPHSSYGSSLEAVPLQNSTGGGTQLSPAGAATAVGSSLDVGGTVGGTGAIRLPELTVEERESALGKSMTHMVSLFFSLRDVLLRERAAAAAERATSSVASVEEACPVAAASAASQKQLNEAYP